MSGALGVGIGWRAELAVAIDRYPRLGFVELLLEHFDPAAPLPDALLRLRERGVQFVIHAVGLSLGSAEGLDRRTLDGLARLAEKTGAAAVSEHLSFVRSQGRESGHLVPLPFTEESLDVLCENVRTAQRVLGGVPLALENIAAPLRWPDDAMDEAHFVRAAVERTGSRLLLDVANLYANAKNHRFDACAYLDALPLDRIAYVHLAGGIARGGLYHDTHAHPVPNGALALTTELIRRAPVPGLMLERDDAFPKQAELHSELDVLGRLHEATASSTRTEPQVRTERAAPVNHGASGIAPDVSAPAALRPAPPTLAAAASEESVAIDDDAACRNISSSSPSAPSVASSEPQPLAQRQALLLDALWGVAPSPPGFDGARIAAIGASLSDKRRHAVERAWPRLAGALGASFAARFDSYARRVGLPSIGGPVADGWYFARHLADGGALPAEGDAERRRIAQSFRVTAGGLVPRALLDRSVRGAVAWLSTRTRTLALMAGIRRPRRVPPDSLTSTEAART